MQFAGLHCHPSLRPGPTVEEGGEGEEANRLPLGPEPKLAYFMTLGFPWGNWESLVLTILATGVVTLSLIRGFRNDGL